MGGLGVGRLVWVYHGRTSLRKPALDSPGGTLRRLALGAVWDDAMA